MLTMVFQIEVSTVCFVQSKCVYTMMCAERIYGPSCGQGDDQVALDEETSGQLRGILWGPVDS